MTTLKLYPTPYNTKQFHNPMLYMCPRSEKAVTAQDCIEFIKQ